MEFHNWDVEELRVWEKSVGNICIIEISGRMDTAGSKEIDAKLNSLLENDRAEIIIDLGAVDYISSVGLRVLLAALKKQKGRQGSMKLVSLQPFVRDVFKMTGFDKIFSIYSTQEEAMSSSMQPH